MFNSSGFVTLSYVVIKTQLPFLYAVLKIASKIKYPLPLDDLPRKHPINYSIIFDVFY